MTRRHRFAHRLFWPALGILVALGFLLALVQRAPAATPCTPFVIYSAQQ